MADASIIRKHADDLRGQGKITRRERRTIVDRLDEHGSPEVDEQTLRSTILADLPGHVVTKLLQRDLSSPPRR